MHVGRHAREALRQMHICVRAAKAVFADEIRGVHHQRVAFPMAARIAHPLREYSGDTCGRPSSGITRASWIISLENHHVVAASARSESRCCTDPAAWADRPSSMKCSARQANVLPDHRWHARASTPAFHPCASALPAVSGGTRPSGGSDDQRSAPIRHQIASAIAPEFVVRTVRRPPAPPPSRRSRIHLLQQAALHSRRLPAR